MEKKAVVKNYIFLGIMLGAMVLGAIVGWLAPTAAGVLKPFGTVFINMMFCVVVPLVFVSIAGSIANMKSMKRAGKIMGTTVATFVITGAIAAVIMFALMKIFPPVLVPWNDIPSEEIGEYASISDMIVNFFTASDFVGLLTRKAMLPLIVFSVLFGFATNMAGGSETLVAKWLSSMTEVMMKFIKIITYYAPVAFFAIFAGLVADYGPQIAGSYGRAMAVYYPCASSTSSPPSPCSHGSAAASTVSRPCSATSPSPLWCLWAPAPLWLPSPPTWKRLRIPASARTWPRWSCLWALPCTWTAPASPAC